MSSQPGSVEQVRRDFSELLSRFEESWEYQGEPEISDFLTSSAVDDQTVRHQLLLELVKIDLASRWQRALPKGGDIAAASEQSERTLQLPRVERYVVEWPEIGPNDSLDIDLIVHEYQIRHRFGDRPGLEEYETRFPTHGEPLATSLEEVECELRETREGSTAPGLLLAAGDTNRTLLPRAGGSEPTTDVDPRPADRSDRRTAAEPVMGNFGNYDLQEELGRGAMGIVYRARQLRPDRPVALKTISKGKLASVEQVRTFYAEANSAGNLRHPHIVTVYDSGEIDGQHYFSMAFIEGQNLDEITPAGETMDPRRAAQYIRTTAEAIEYAHSMGVLHRDLKPGNILIDENDQPHVADFGIASRIEDDATSPVHGEVVGTPSFMPPEQAQGRADLIGPVSDVYSLGATLYFLLTGVAPFGGGDVLTTLMQVVEDQPAVPRKFNRAVDRYLQAICLKCLAKNPSDRYSSAQALADDLGRYLRDEPTEALPPPLVIRLRKWSRRNPAVARLAVVIVLILLGTSGVMSTLYLQLRVMHGSVSELQDDKNRLGGEVVGLEEKARDSKQAAATSEKLAVASELKEKESSRRAVAADEKFEDADRKLTATNAELTIARTSLKPLKSKLAASNKQLKRQTAYLVVAQRKVDAKQKEVDAKQKEVTQSNLKLKANALKLLDNEKELARLAVEQRKQLVEQSKSQRELGETHRTLDRKELARLAFVSSIAASLALVEQTRGSADQRDALLDLANSSRLLGDLHADFEELADATKRYDEAARAIVELRRLDPNGEAVQFSSAQLLNSQSIVFETQGRLKEQLDHLGQARDEYIALVRTAPKASQSRYKRKLARTYYNLGRGYDRRCSQGITDDWNEVLNAFNEAASRLESLRALSGQPRELKLSVIQELAQTLQVRSSGWLGYAEAAPRDSALERERMNRAIQDVDESILLCQTLVEKAPKNPQYKVDRIYARIIRAGLFPGDQAGNTRAEKLYQAEIATLEAIVQEHQVPSHRSLLADALDNLGILYQDWRPTRQVGAQKRLTQARDQFDAALKQRQRLFGQYQGLARYRFGLAGTLFNLADLLNDRDRPAAVKAAQEGVEHIKELLVQFPERRDYKSLAEDLQKLSTP